MYNQRIGGAQVDGDIAGEKVKKSHLGLSLRGYGKKLTQS
jgi:hypothetical protein